MPKLTYLGNIFHVTEEYEDIVDAVISKGSSLSHGQRLYFESADFEVQAGVILKRHEITTPDNVPERLRIDNILLRHRNMNKTQAAQYKDYMLRSDFTYPAAIAEMDKRLRLEGVDNTLSYLEKMAYEMEACDVGIDDALHPRNQDDAIMPTYGFHKIDTMYVQPIEMPWMLKQPELVRRLITTPKRCTNLNQLRNLGKACYEAEKAANPAPYQKVYRTMNNNQKSIFWDAYNRKKRELMEGYKLSNTGKALVKRISTARKQELPRLKANLVRLQKGQIKMRDPPSLQEWDVVWYYFTQRNASP